MSGAYYNDNDPFAAAWLRELIKADLIAPGEVDERSIEDIIPTELAGFTQCHFFAGIGVWSYALRLAGWPDEKPVWTGSCPCQPFSAAGKGVGFADERHLWPAWFHLIEQCTPDRIFGEQVASKDGLAWFDLVSSDLENAKYTVGAGDICAAGVGAPHIRQRLYFVADSERKSGCSEYEHESRERSSPQPEHGAKSWRGGEVDTPANTEGDNRRAQLNESGAQRGRARLTGSGATGTVANAGDSERGRRAQSERNEQRGILYSANRGSSYQLGNAVITRLEGHAGNGDNGNESGRIFAHESRSTSETGMPGHVVNTASEQVGLSGCARQSGATNGFWADAEWVYCKDGRYRAVEPGTFPLVNGAPHRVGRLRGYGNAINAEVAQAFIEAYMSEIGYARFLHTETEKRADLLGDFDKLINLTD